MYKQYAERKKHFYHLVDASPWPIVVSFLMKSFAILLALSFHYDDAWILFGCLDVNNVIYLTNNIVYLFIFYLNDLNIYFWYFFVSCLSSAIIFWFRDVVLESTSLGYHTKNVKKLLRFGFLLFIMSEVMFFFSFFWTFFHSSLVPSIQIGGIWPPLSVVVPYTWDLPFLNTILLLSSGAWITAAHYMLLSSGNKKDNFDYFYFGVPVCNLSDFVKYFCSFESYSNILATLNFKKLQLLWVKINLYYNSVTLFNNTNNLYVSVLYNFFIDRKDRFGRNYKRLHTTKYYFYNRVRLDLPGMFYEFFMFKAYKTSFTKDDCDWFDNVINFVKKFFVNMFNFWAEYIILSSLSVSKSRKYIFEDLLSILKVTNKNIENFVHRSFFERTNIGQFIRFLFFCFQSVIFYIIDSSLFQSFFKFWFYIYYGLYVRILWCLNIFHSVSVEDDFRFYALLDYKNRLFNAVKLKLFFIYNLDFFNEFSSSGFLLWNSRLRFGSFKNQNLFLSFNMLLISVNLLLIHYERLNLSTFEFKYFKLHTYEKFYDFYLRLYERILKEVKLYITNLFLFLTLICGAAFLFCQAAEYYENLFEICDSVYGSTFYIMTGFHGLHVLVGMIFIFVIKFRLNFKHFTKRHHLGLSFSIWYWHFVDIVWIILFLIVYIWGS